MAKQSGEVAERPGGEAFEALLCRLAPERDAAGAEYQRLHRRLVAYFESHGSREPALDADETLDRLARKLREGHAIRDVPAYVHGLARYVLRESWRRTRRDEARRRALDEVSPSPPGDDVLWACFDRCLAELEPAQREILLVYYAASHGTSRAWRAELAASRGVSLNALRIRVFRAREALRERLLRCLSERERT